MSTSCSGELKIFPFSFCISGQPSVRKGDFLNPEKIAADNILIFHFYLSKKIRFDFSSESSALQTIHMKYQVLFSLKNNEEIFMNIVCCSRDWHFKA